MDIRKTVSFVIVLVLLLMSACTGGGATEQTYTIGVLNYIPVFDLIFESFVTSMAELDYVEGENVTYLYDGPAENLEALDEVIENLKEQDIDLLLTFGTPASTRGYAAFADTDVAILFMPVNDPVEAGLVESMSAPGGNCTGLTFPPTEIKIVEWLLEMLPETQKILVPHNPTDPSSLRMLETLMAAEDDLGVEFLIEEVSTSEEVTTLAQAIPDDADAVYIGPVGIVNTRIEQFIETANEHGIPVVGGSADIIGLGLLINYSTVMPVYGVQGARLADQIFEGIPPADLPVEQAEATLTINLQAAETIGVEIPDSFLERADEIYHGNE